MKSLKVFFLIFPSIIFFSCETNIADLIIQNGMVYTVDEFKPTVEAVAVKNGKILAVGTVNSMRSLIGDNTKRLDLKGATMVPGLIEGHGHFMGVGYARMRLDLLSVSSYDELVDMVAGAVKKTEPGEWILGRGWHQSKWSPEPSPVV